MVRELKILKPIAKLEDVKALDAIANPVKKVVLALAKPRAFEDLMHGTPFGHPVHPVLVLVPTGAWSSVALLDLLPGNERAARILTLLGVVSAAPTMATGYTDWARMHEQQLRVGVVHSAFNWAALALYTASYLQRVRDPKAGKLLAFLGFGAVGFGGYLGGHLAYRQAGGANHIEDVPHRFPAGWQQLGAVADLPENELVRRDVAGQPLLVHREGGDVHVLSGLCSHLSGPLDEGTLVMKGGDACVQCPWHDSVFALKNGEVVHGPATSPQHVFQTRVTGGLVEINLPNAG